MIGIRFEIPNKYGMFLKKIFENVNLSDYYWNIIDEEILFLDEFSLDKEQYSFDEMSVILEKNMYLIFGNIQLTKSCNEVSMIKSYTDFVKSECEILILIVDSSYVDIYSKKKDILVKINENARLENYEKIEYIYNDDNPRNILYY